MKRLTWMCLAMPVVLALSLGSGRAGALVRHRHRHHHHHRTGVTCGPGTHVAGTPAQCVPDGTSDAGPGCTVTPNPATVRSASTPPGGGQPTVEGPPATGDVPGTVLLTVVCSGLTPNVPLIVSSQSLDALCGSHTIIFPSPPPPPPPPPPPNEGIQSGKEEGTPPGIMSSGTGSFTAAILAGPVCNAGVFTVDVSLGVPPGTTYGADGRLLV